MPTSQNNSDHPSKVVVMHRHAGELATGDDTPFSDPREFDFKCLPYVETNSTLDITAAGLYVGHDVIVVMESAFTAAAPYKFTPIFM